MKKIQLTEEELHNLIKESLEEISLKHAAAGLGALGLMAGGVNACQSDYEDAHAGDPSKSDPEGEEITRQEGQTHHAYDDGTYQNDDWMYESKMRMSKILRESINKVLNEISADTIDSARDKAFEKYKKLDNNSASTSRVNHAYHQAEKFSNEYTKRYKEGNEAKKARMDKNREDRDNGTRTYIKGKGWRTNSNN